MRSWFLALPCVLVIAIPAVCQPFQDGSFELQTPGMPVGGVWVESPTPTGSSPSRTDIWTAVASGFPSEGAHYLWIESPDAVGTPGHGPHATPGVTKVHQEFTISSHETCSIRIKWEWLIKEPSGSSNNDFLSIDLYNTMTGMWHNLLYADATNTMAGSYTNASSGAHTSGLDYVNVDAASLVEPGVFRVVSPAYVKSFTQDLTAYLSSPSATDTVRLEIAVGNGGTTSSGGNSVALIDQVEFIVPQNNSPVASFKTHTTEHEDGESTALDFGGDYAPGAPFELTTRPGGSLCFRASSIHEGTPWALVAGNMQKVGLYVAPFFTLNLDPSSMVFVIDGIQPGGPGGFIGTINNGHNYISAFIAPSTALGTRVAFQAVMASPTSPFPFEVSAATEVVVGTQVPSWPTGSTPVTAGSVMGINAPTGGAQSDDGATRMDLAALGFGQGGFPFYGTFFSRVWVNSNGSLTFGDYDTDWTESEAEMLTDPFGKMAVLWDDFNPNSNGFVRFSVSPNELTVSWDDVVEFGNSASRNNFAVRLYPDGGFTFYYGSTSMSDGLVGISPGNLAAPLPGTIASQDWSSTNHSFGDRSSIPAGTARFEHFQNTLSVPGLTSDTFDIATIGNPGPARIHFIPHVSGGYTFFTGTQ